MKIPSTIILGIDPGLANTGYGFIEVSGSDLRLLDSGVIETETEIDKSIRLAEIGADLDTLISKYQPRVLGVEKLFFQANVKTAMAVSEARGVILERAAAHGLQILEFTPQQAKMAVTGDGSADKKQVQKMVKQILQLSRVPTPSHTADALAMAIAASLEMS